MSESHEPETRVAEPPEDDDFDLEQLEDALLEGWERERCQAEKVPGGDGTDPRPGSREGTS